MLGPKAQKKVLHPIRKHADASQYFPVIQVINIDPATGHEIPVKGVLKGGEVPPLNKKYKRINDVVTKPKSSGSPDSASSSGNLQ